MKRVFIVSVLLSFVLMCGAQKREVTKFMGIPVDGTVEQFEKELLKKGFKKKDNPFTSEKMYSGEFNGRESNVYVIESRGKVYRVNVCDNATCSEKTIRERYNHLCKQFCTNEKYINFYIDYDNIMIPEDKVFVDFSKETFSTLFFQGKESEIDNEFYLEQLEKLKKANSSATESDLRTEALFNTFSLKGVWFRIFKVEDGDYYIGYYYDNLYNQSFDDDI